MNIFVKLLIKPILCVWLLMVFHDLKFLLASLKSRTTCENHASNHLEEVCSGIPIAACDSKSCSESRLGTWKLPIPKAVHEYTLENSTNEIMREKENRNKNLMRL
jgi:hypothetical protein